MKTLVCCFVLCLLCCFIQDGDAQPSIPLLTVTYDDSKFTPPDYYTVYITLINGEAEADRDEITTYLAAVNHDGNGNLGAGINNCGSNTPLPGATTNPFQSIELNFILEKSSGNVVTDVTNAAVYTAANTPTAPSTPFLNGASGVTTCGVVADTSVVADGLRLVIQTFISANDASTAGTYSVYYDFTLGDPTGTVNSGTGTFSKGDTNYLPPTYVVTPPSPPIALPRPTITSTLEVIDDSGAVITMINLGDEFKLRLTVTVEVGASVSYIVGLDLAGDVVKECSVATDAGISADVRMFIQNYCSVDTDIFRTSVVGSGFQKSSSSLAGKIKTYVAESHRLEAAALFPSPDTTTTMHDLYFECTVEPTCYDDTSGSCSGSHCTTRKKRSVDRVETKLHVLPDNTFETSLPTETETVEKPRPCAETLMFKGTIGALGSAVVLLFYGVIFSYYDLRRAQRKAKARSHGLDSCKMSGGSCTQLKADSLSSISSDWQNRKC